MPPYRARILLAVAAVGLFFEAVPLRGQRAPEPQWVDMTPAGKLVVKALEFTGGTVSIRGGLVVHPNSSPKGVFLGRLGIAKPESMDVDLFLDVLNETPNAIWVEMEIDIPGQEKGAVKSQEIKTKHGNRQMWTVKDLQWGFPYPIKVFAYSDKKKTNSPASTTASLVFDEADKATVAEARVRAANELRKGGLTYVTLSGWGKPSAEELAAAEKKEEEMNPPPPFKWKENEASPGVMLTATERRRDSGPNGQGTMVEFELLATGFEAGEDLTLWTRWLGDHYVKVSNVSLDEKGSVLAKDKGKAMHFTATVGGMAAGEPVSWALASATANKRAYARAVIVPIESHSAEGCSASAEIQTPTGLLFLVTFRGFAPGEEVAVTSEYKDENKASAVHADDKGVVAFPVLFGEGDHGKAKAVAAGKTCKVSLEYAVGPDALVKR